ncbi:hypothetical protein AB0E62_36765 [Streptomyces sp. NPDC038707]|jgi:hypothetical protein|uniref:hypothetical protein n=1 Tax=Streptomyces sp. NPDC038707 TaxID=3154329 RepID=UPI0033DABD79
MSGTLSCVGVGRPEPEPARGSTVVIAVLIILVALSSVALPWRDMLAALVVEVMTAISLAALQAWRTDGRHA